ncbi:beta-propeller fold lactonase family protein [Bradyrhizobium sp. 13971]
MAPGGGYGFGPRHLDFHPTQPWVYVSLERQNKLDVFKLQNDSLDPQPIFRKDTLAEPAISGPASVLARFTCTRTDILSMWPIGPTP